MRPIDRLMTMVTDAQVPPQGRLENLDQVRPAYEDALPLDRVKLLFERLAGWRAARRTPSTRANIWKLCDETAKQ